MTLLEAPGEDLPIAAPTESRFMSTALIGSTTDRKARPRRSSVPASTVSRILGKSEVSAAR